jgi:hypothetical protein
MRQLFVVALAVGLVAAPACAQRGGGGRGGFGGGGHAGFSSRGGSSGVSSGHFAGRAFAPRYGAGVRAGSGAPMARFVRPGVSGARPSFYNRGFERRREGFGFRAPYGYAVAPWYGDYGWLDADDSEYGDSYGYADDGGYGDGPDVATGSYGDQVPENYVEQPDGYAQAGVQYAQPESEVEPPYAERAQGMVAQTPAVAPSLFYSNAVTLVFKDGRPSQTIHNYALTRTTLYVTDGRPREIPVEALDLAATEKANREAGVNFRLPVMQ